MRPSPRALWLAALLLVFGGCAGTDGPRPIVPGDDLYDPSPARRSEAVAAVAETRDTRYLGRLVEMLEDPDPAVRALANQTLEELTGRRTAYAAFAPVDERRRHADAWRAWVGGTPATPAAPPVVIPPVATPPTMTGPPVTPTVISPPAAPQGAPVGAVRGSG